MPRNCGRRANRTKKARKMTIRAAFEKFAQRGMNFSTFRAALNYHKLPTSRSWAPAERKITDSADTPDKVANAIKLLNQIYEDNIRYGNKAVQIAVFDSTVAPLFLKLRRAHFKPEYVPAVPFPGPATAKDLASISMQPVLMHVADDGDGFTLFFYARAYLTEKEQFAVDQMTDEISQRRFAGFDQVVAYKRKPYVRIDSIHIDLAAHRVEFRADATRLESLERMHEALKALKDAFRAYLMKHVDAGWKNIQFPLVNFYPKIKPAYDDANGKVVRLGHNTSAGAINYGKMRGLAGNLKEDPAHVASMSAGVTESFSITKAFSYDDNYCTVRVSIPGRSVDASQGPPTVETSIIEDCHRREQFEDMMSILR